MTVIYALVPCSKTKAAVRCAAVNMYWRSALFRGAFQVAEAAGQQVLILSALHAVLWPGDVIDPYNVTLNGMQRADRWEWACRVLYELQAILRPGDKVVSYLGATYAEFVVAGLQQNGFTVVELLKGMGQGKRLAWFKQTLAQREVA